MAQTEDIQIQDQLEQMRQSVLADPTCGVSRYNYALALLARNRFAEARKELEEAVKCSPTLAEAFVLLGGICMEEDDLEGCLDYNRKAVNARENFSQGYGNIGFVCLQQGKINEAIQALEKAIAINPHFLQAYTNLGSAYLMQGLVDKCIEINNKALALEPSFAVAHNNLAIAHLEKGEAPQAVAHCDQAEKLGYEVAPEIKKEIDSLR